MNGAESPCARAARLIDAFVREHADLARWIACRYAVRNHPLLDHDASLSAAFAGLLYAASRWHSEPDAGRRRTYAWTAMVCRIHQLRESVMAKRRGGARPEGREPEDLAALAAAKPQPDPIESEELLRAIRDAAGPERGEAIIRCVGEGIDRGEEASRIGRSKSWVTAACGRQALHRLARHPALAPFAPAGFDRAAPYMPHRSRRAALLAAARQGD